MRNVPSQQGSEVVANAKGHAIEVFSNILSEIRAYGEGMLIAEQVPVKLTPDAIKNTSLKIAHRLLAEDDRRAMAETMGLGPSQSRYLRTLAAGEAIAFAEGLRTPVLIAVPQTAARRSPVPIADATVATHMTAYWKRRAGLRRRFPGCSRCTAFGAHASCDGALEVSMTDPSARRALHHLFGAMVHDHALVVDAFMEVETALRPFTSSRPTPFTYCLLVSFLEDAIDKRGVFHGWTFSEVEEAGTWASSVAWTLAVDFGNAASPSVAQRLTSDLSAFGTLMHRLRRRDGGPFAACSSCRDPCHYRFEMAARGSESPSLAGDFRDFFDRDIDIDELSRFLCDEAAALFIEKAPERLKDAAFCLFAQEISRMGYPFAQQRDLGSSVRTALENLEDR